MKWAVACSRLSTRKVLEKVSVFPARVRVPWWWWVVGMVLVCCFWVARYKRGVSLLLVVYQKALENFSCLVEQHLAVKETLRSHLGTGGGGG
jgi:hypothetical protein